MALTVARLYITEVPSDDWQAHFGIVSVKKAEGESTKEQALHIAQTLYPNEDFRKSGRSHTVHDGIVDAVLIAEYCQSLFAPFQEPATGVQLISTRDETPVEVKKVVVRPGGMETGTKMQRRMI
jgi:hypothetical protein